MALILVVDDDDSIRKTLTHILKREGHDVFEAANGTAAVDQCRELMPDLTLMDIYMPGQDGIETIRALRKEVPDLKVVAMSGEQLELVGADVLKMATMLGAIGALRKPFDTEEVVDVVTEALGG